MCFHSLCFAGVGLYIACLYVGVSNFFGSNGTSSSCCHKIARF